MLYCQFVVIVPWFSLVSLCTWQLSPVFWHLGAERFAWEKKKKKRTLWVLPAWAAHFIDVKPSLIFCGNPEQKGEWRSEREVGWGRPETQLLVPLEFDFAEQIIWLTGVLRCPLPRFFHLSSFPSPVPLCPLPLSSGLGKMMWCVQTCSDRSRLAGP